MCKCMCVFHQFDVCVCVCVCLFFNEPLWKCKFRGENCDISLSFPKWYPSSPESLGHRGTLFGSFSERVPDLFCRNMPGKTYFGIAQAWLSRFRGPSENLS